MAARNELPTNNETVDNNGYLDKDYGSDAALKRIRTAGSISISPELFEKLYLSPEKKVKGEQSTSRVD